MQAEEWTRQELVCPEAAKFFSEPMHLYLLRPHVTAEYDHLLRL
jgi:hypothetical protein